MSLTTKEKLSSIKRYHQAKFSSPVVHRRLTELLRIRAVNFEAAGLLGWAPISPPTSTVGHLVGQSAQKATVGHLVGQSVPKASVVHPVVQSAQKASVVHSVQQSAQKDNCRTFCRTTFDTKGISPVPNNLFELKEIKQEEGTEYISDSTILVPSFQTASNRPVKEEPIEEEAFIAIKEEAVDPQEQRAPFSEFHLEWYLDDIYIRFPGASPQEAEELLVQVITQELALLNLGHI